MMEGMASWCIESVGDGNAKAASLMARSPVGRRIEEYKAARNPQSTSDDVYLRPAFSCDLITFLTIFASSTRNARRMLIARLDTVKVAS